ncbi:MAG: hypothetical protein PVJ27_08475, partial [Candidatus Brocadiaceae bacterium]
MRVTCWAMALMLMAFVGSDAAMGAQVVVDGSKKEQTIEGFGTCLISWVDRFRELYRTEEFQRLYVNEVGCNMMRVNLWGPVSEEPVEDWRDIRWQDFDMSIQRARIFVDFGKGIRRFDPDARIIGTVWTPPPWMKADKSWNDESSGAIRADSYEGMQNRLLPEYYMHYAKWMVEMAKMHETMEAPLYAISPGNEVQFTQEFGSCVWTGEDYARIVELLGEMLEREGMGHIKIYGPETMTGHFYEGGTPAYIETAMGDPEARTHFDVIATHGYEDGFAADTKASSSRRLWELVEQFNRPLWMTEGGTGGHEWPEPLHQGIAAAIHNSLVAGHCSAFVPWQIIGGRRTGHCLMVLEDGEPVFTPKTAAAMHYFRFIGAGWTRVTAEPAYGDVKASAYTSPEGDALTMVLLNPTDRTQTVTLALRNVPRLGRVEV